MKRLPSVGAVLLVLAVLLAAPAAAQEKEAKPSKHEAPAWTTPPVVKHSLEGRSNCLMCHKPGAMKNVPDAPASHAGRTIAMCPVCHKPAKSEEEEKGGV